MSRLSLAATRVSCQRESVRFPPAGKCCGARVRRRDGFRLCWPTPPTLTEGTARRWQLSMGLLSAFASPAMLSRTSLRERWSRGRLWWCMHGGPRPTSRGWLGWGWSLSGWCCLRLIVGYICRTVLAIGPVMSRDSFQPRWLPWKRTRIRFSPISYPNLQSRRPASQVCSAAWSTDGLQRPRHFRRSGRLRACGCERTRTMGWSGLGGSASGACHILLIR
mmetsp:Transcript_1519/g.3622  ORF Transcript_1519/g.3622 Transcript_1519/m.3622 type:complete len:220 (+) Transcript_1519:590-1249(+)